MMKILKLNNTTSIGDFLSEWIKTCNLEQVKKGELFGFVKDGMKLLIANLDGKIPVSYTHLTLPTNREV